MITFFFFLGMVALFDSSLVLTNLATPGRKERKKRRKKKKKKGEKKKKSLDRLCIYWPVILVV